MKATSRQSIKAKSSRREAGPRLRDPDVTRLDILQVSVVEFAEKGLSGARIDKIAARTNTSKRMIYYYFGSKDGLYIAVLEHVYETQRRLESRFDYGQLTPEAAMEKLIGFAFDHHFERPNFIRIVMDENLHCGRHVCQSVKIKQLNVAVIEILRDILARGEKAGSFRTGLNPVDVHLTISALCFHYVANRYTFSTIFEIDMESPAAVAGRRDTVIKIVMAAIRA